RAGAIHRRTAAAPWFPRIGSIPMEIRHIFADARRPAQRGIVIPLREGRLCGRFREGRAQEHCQPCDHQAHFALRARLDTGTATSKRGNAKAAPACGATCRWPATLTRGRQLDYSITWSARSRSDEGNSRPTALAVLRLRMVSNLVALS